MKYGSRWLLGCTILLASCQKEGNNNNNPPAANKPKVGTVWVYSYYTYNIGGGVATTKTVTHKAVSEQTFGGEQWLKINETGVDTTVYYLREKADGLYQFANGAAQLFCKEPAAAGQTYTSFNAGGSENFTVVNAGFTLPTNLGDIKVNYYEGSKNSEPVDEIWYNTNAWIVRRHTYRKPPLGTPYKYTGLFIQSVTY